MLIKVTVKPNNGNYIQVTDSISHTKWGIKPGEKRFSPKVSNKLVYREVSWVGDHRKKGYEVGVEIEVPEGYRFYILNIYQGGTEILYDPLTAVEVKF